MAISKDFYVERFNVTIPDCYWKIDAEKGLCGGKGSILVTMNCFKDKASADINTNGDNLYYTFQYMFTPDLGSVDNFFKQAYTVAKALPEMEGSVDII